MTERVMRAKMVVGHVQEHVHQHGSMNGQKHSESLSMYAVAASKYPEDGSDEDNTYAKFSPGASLNINIANPALFGKFKHGDRFYVDFIPADVPAPVEEPTPVEGPTTNEA